MLLLISPYLHIADILGYRTYAEVKGMLPTWKSYLFPSNTSVLWSFLNENFKPAEAFWLHYNFIGMIPTIALVSIPFLWIYWKVKKIKPSTLLLSMSISIFIIFIFYFKFDNGDSLYKYLFHLPGMRSIRVMNRYLHVVLFLILILMSTFLLKLPKKWIPVILLLVILDNSFYSENIYRQEKKVITERRESTIKWVVENRKEKDVAFAIINPNEPFFMTHIDAMLTALELKFPTLNGYTSHGPVEHSEFFQEDNIEGLEKWLKFNHIPKDSVLILYRD